MDGPQRYSIEAVVWTTPGAYGRESCLLISKPMLVGQRSLGDFSKNKQLAGTLPPNINTQPLAGTSTTPTIANMLTALAPLQTHPLPPDLPPGFPPLADLCKPCYNAVCPVSTHFCGSDPSDMLLARAHPKQYHQPGSLWTASIRPSTTSKWLLPREEGQITTHSKRTAVSAVGLGHTVWLQAVPTNECILGQNKESTLQFGASAFEFLANAWSLNSSPMQPQASPLTTQGTNPFPNSTR